MMAILKHISPLISPELLKLLAEMGHGDTIALCDSNYPAMSCDVPNRIRADGLPMTGLLTNILHHFPLDNFVRQPVTFMSVADGDDYKPEIWSKYYALLDKYRIAGDQIEYLERMEFYRRVNTAYCVVATGERQRYANIILKKGIIEPTDEEVM